MSTHFKLYNIFPCLIINDWCEVTEDLLLNSKDFYSEKLKEFKEKYSVPEHFLNNYVIPDSKFNIYNTEDEKIKYIEYWKNK